MMDSSYNWKNIATAFMNAAKDKEVLQKVSTSLVFSILSVMRNSIFGVNVSVAKYLLNSCVVV